MSRLVFILIVLLLYSCGLNRNKEIQWFKGNTHAHTTLSDGNALPDDVVSWYYDKGYNFLILTDHNLFIDPDTMKIPSGLRNDFILIPGIEVTGKRAIHSTGLNVNAYVHPGLEYNSKTEVIQSHVDSIRATNGIPILNHPNFGSGAQVADIMEVKGLFLIELYNGHPSVHNFGFIGEDYSHIPVEAKWDSLLSLGKRIYGLASDDTHHYDEYNKFKANPGRGWVMVKSKELSADAIVMAIQEGDFYASNGVMLRSLSIRDKSYNLEVDPIATEIVLRSPDLRGDIVETEKPGYRIEFIGLDGEIMQSTEGLSAKYKIRNETGYIRARAIYCRKTADNKYEKLFAWTQPVFLE
ncbi:MAG: CehA/McbA family metallohydrolase [Bacteroidales bacterium]|nr:CehA/McbA family metallohydrolase [Bacteroidales bacterium]